MPARPGVSLIADSRTGTGRVPMGVNVAASQRCQLGVRELEQEMEVDQLVERLAFARREDAVLVPCTAELGDGDNREGAVGTVTECREKARGGFGERIRLEVLERGGDLLAEIGHLAKNGCRHLVAVWYVSAISMRGYPKGSVPRLCPSFLFVLQLLLQLVHEDDVRHQFPV
jgi:hypothetical protein